MEVGRLETWLGRRLANDANTCLSLSPIAIFGALLVLVFTYWFSYAVIWMVLKVVLAVPELLAGIRVSVGHRGRLILAGAFLLLLLVSYLRSDRWQRQDYSSFDGEPSTLGQTLARFGGGRTVLLLMHPEASSRMIVELLYVGPQLLFNGWNLLLESGRIRSSDVPSGARILWTLLNQPRRVGYPELEALYPAEELVRGFNTLRRIDGVVFLEQGVTLSSELRAEFTESQLTSG